MANKVNSLQPADLNPSYGYTKRLGLFGALTAGLIVANSEYQKYQANQTHAQDRQAIVRLNGELTTSQATIAKLELNIKDTDAVNKSQENTIKNLTQAKIEQSVDIGDLIRSDEISRARIYSMKDDISKLQTQVSSLQDTEVSKIYQKAIHSVVSLYSKYETETTDEMGNKKKVTQGQNGTGVVLAHIGNGKKGGYIITNWHNVHYEGITEDSLKNLEVKVRLPDGTTTKAKQYFYNDENGKLVSAKDEECDLTLLIVNSDISNTNPIEVSMSEPNVGDSVLVIGSPFRLDGSLSRGIVSSLRDVKLNGGIMEIDPSDKTKMVRAIQTDAAMNPGNSGGAGISEKDGKLFFMPTLLVTGANRGVGLGIAAQEIVNRAQKWIPYKVNASGKFVEIKTETNPEIVSKNKE